MIANKKAIASAGRKQAQQAAGASKQHIRSNQKFIIALFLAICTLVVLLAVAAQAEVGSSMMIRPADCLVDLT